MSAHTLHAALALRALSIGTIPVHDKAPALAAWTQYQERLATPEELAAQHKNGVDLAVIMGTVSANLETLDIDAPALIAPLKDQVRALAGDDLLDKLVMARTPSGGEHWYYRHTAVPEGSMVLARDHAGAIAIETRGQGGYAVIPPSAGRTYLQGSLGQVKTISTAERSGLLMAARALHVPPPDPVHEKAAITQAMLLYPKMPHGHKLVLLALLQELAFDAWTDITAEGISRRYHMGLRQAKERLRALVALGVIKEKCVYQTDGDDAPRPRYLRRLHRDAINDYWFPKGTSTPAPPVSRPSLGDFYDRFNALVSIRELVQVSHTGKVRAFWRGEQHASVHLHPPDATCPYEHACDYGDNNRHMDAFDVYCLVQGFYRWDGTLHLDKRAGMRAARAEYPALQSESAPTVTGLWDQRRPGP